MSGLNTPIRHANPLQAVNRFFRGYFKTSGRASISEYWWAQLFVMVTIIAPIVIGTIIVSNDVNNPMVNHLANFTGFWSLAMIVPSLTSASRRLRDTGMSDKKRSVLLTVSTLITFIASYAISSFSLLGMVPLFSLMFFTVLMPFSSLLLVFWTVRRSGEHVSKS